MSEITYIRCDRCGNTNERPGGCLSMECSNGYGYLQPLNGDRCIDLCQMCEQDFVVWLRNERQDDGMKSFPQEVYPT